MTRTTRIFSVSAFPAVMSAALGAAIWLIHRGVDPALALIPSTFGAYLIIALCERRFPLYRSWLHSRGDLGTDTGLFFVNGAVIAVTTPLVLGGSVWLASALSDRLAAGAWPSSWPLLAQLGLALVVAEFVEYWFHRIMHEVPWLWRFHATHHSAPRLYWLNAVRFHPVDLFLVGVVKLAPLAALGAGGAVFALVNVFSGVHGAFQHANLQLRLGPLNWIFSMAELHRWHHSKRVSEANHNYGGNLILWDIVFATRWLPRDREPPEAIGIGDLPAFPAGLLANLKAPLRWSEVEREARAGA